MSARSNSAPSAQQIFGPETGGLSFAPRTFETVTDSHYRLTIAGGAIVLDLDRLRRERHELIGELAVSCSLPGCQTIDGALSVADFNLSSAQARATRAKLLAARSVAIEGEWAVWLEELCQRVLAADRAGQPGVLLSTVPRSDHSQTWTIGGLELLPKHPAILFGDGASGKSYLALWLAGHLAKCGITVGLFDWELDPGEHRDRLERLFGPEFPDLVHIRCERPLVAEVDRLRRLSLKHDLQYAIYDSIAFACEGAPEAAEVAAAYFRAVRQIGQFGSLHIAHVTKAEGGDMKPFGSAFWHNGARATWNIKQAEGLRLDGSVAIGVYPRKANLGPLPPSCSFRVVFEAGRTVIESTNITNEPSLAINLRVREQIIRYLSMHGACTIAELCEATAQKLDTVKKTLAREADTFTRLQSSEPGAVTKWGLLERQITDTTVQ